MACESAGQQIAVADVDESPAIEFRFSKSRQMMVAVAALPVLGAALVAGNLAQSRQWWTSLPVYAMILLFSVALTRWDKRRGPRLPLRLTGEALEVAGPDGSTLTTGWSNITDAYVHGRWIPYLVVKLVDPEQTQPPLAQWPGAESGQLRPAEIAIPLAHMTPGRDVLRRELARRLPKIAR